MTGEKTESQSLFRLAIPNDGQVPIMMYTELDVNVLELKLPKVGFLTVEDLNN